MIRLLAFLLIPMVANSGEFALNFYHADGVSQNPKVDKVLMQIFESEKIDFTTISEHGLREGSLFFWGETALNCKPIKATSYTVYETPDSYLVDISLSSTFMEKLNKQSISPILRSKKLDLLICGNIKAFDLSSFGFSRQRALSASLLLRFEGRGQKAFVIPREFGGLDRYYKWEEDHKADLSIIMGEDHPLAKKVKKNERSYLIPSSGYVKKGAQGELPLLVANFAASSSKSKHYSHVKMNKKGRSYVVIGVSEVLEKAEDVSKLDLKEVIKKKIDELRAGADLVVLAGIMSESLLSFIKDIKGVDLIVTAKARYDRYTPLPFQKIRLKSHKVKHYNRAAATIFVDWISATRILITDDDENNLNVSVSNDMLDDSISSTEKYFSGFYVADKSDGGILPPRSQLKPRATQYAREEFAYLCANILVEQLKLEAAITYPYFMASNPSRAISVVVLNQWFPKGEQWLKGTISGEELLKPKGFIIGGVEKGKIGDVPLRPYFRYQVVLPFSRQDEFPSFIADGSDAFDIKKIILNALEKIDRNKIADLIGPQSVGPSLQWSLYLDKAALEINSVSRKNANAFSAVSNSEINTPTSTFVGIDLKGHLRADYRSSVSELGLSALYKSSKIKEGLINELNVLEDDFKVWLGQSFPWLSYKTIGRIGPYLQVLYDSEFSPKLSREKIFNGQIGWKLFDGKHLTDFAIAPFWESDLTDQRAQYGWQIDLKALYKIQYGNFKGGLSFKYYFDSSSTLEKDLRHLFKFEISYENKIFGKFTLAPFFKILHYQAKLTGEQGLQQMVGIKVNFANSWRL